jgi:hypothetical protein
MEVFFPYEVYTDIITLMNAEVYLLTELYTFSLCQTLRIVERAILRTALGSSLSFISLILLIKLINASFFFLQKRAVGWILFDSVCEHLNILEKDYFGLNYYVNGEKVCIIIRYICIFNAVT